MAWWSMEVMMRVVFVVAMGLVLVGCATTVRQQDLDAWRGVPVSALDTHLLFVTMPMRKNIAADGTEVRVYSNSAESTDCRGARGWMQCVTTPGGCHNVFYIRDGIVQEYSTVGQCRTDERVRPRASWRRDPAPVAKQPEPCFQGTDGKCVSERR